jgi:hypothetical protein
VKTGHQHIAAPTTPVVPTALQLLGRRHRGAEATPVPAPRLLGGSAAPALAPTRFGRRWLGHSRYGRQGVGSRPSGLGGWAWPAGRVGFDHPGVWGGLASAGGLGGSRAAD